MVCKASGKVSSDLKCQSSAYVAPGDGYLKHDMDCLHTVGRFIFEKRRSVYLSAHISEEEYMISGGLGP